MKKYILSLMLVLLLVSLVSAESEMERAVRLGHIEFGNAERDSSSIRRYIVNVGTTTALE